MPSGEFVSVEINEVRNYFGNGWTVVAGNKSLMVPRKINALTICVDDRPLDISEMLNPFSIASKSEGAHIQGATPGIASIYAWQAHKSEVNEGDLESACRLVVQAGGRPGSHDILDDGCGHYRLARNPSSFSDGFPTMNVSPNRVVEMINDYKGSNLKLRGHHHNAKIVRIVYDRTKTIRTDGSAFVLDIGYAKKDLYLDSSKVFLNLLETILGLGSPARRVEVFT
jgi:hypothetical protein